MDAYLFLNVPCFDLHISVSCNRQIQLGYLVVLRIVRIEIILAVKFAFPGYLAVGGKADCHSILYHLPVQNRKRPRHASTHRAGVRIGRAPELRAAGAEDLGLSC